jgi:hypothetical protein
MWWKGYFNMGGMWAIWCLSEDPHVNSYIAKPYRVALALRAILNFNFRVSEIAKTFVNVNPGASDQSTRENSEQKWMDPNDDVSEP